ncbi:MFS transporter [Lentzea sp. NPDC059081]|uniref:MFS transporter n=1 Tax=Lentzea sp. NPDC059081 TaxID=3346719 RepID=UPI00368947A0
MTGEPAGALVAGAFAVVMLGATLPTPLYPLYQRVFAFGEGVTTLVFAVYAAGVVGALLVAGGWSDQVGRRPVLRAGVVLSGLSAVTFLVADAPGWLFAGRVLSGLSTGLFTGTATAAILDFAPGTGKRRASLVAAAANAGGLGAGPVLAGVLAQYAPRPLALCFVADLVLVVLAAVCVEAVAEPVRRTGKPRLRPQRIAVPGEVRGVFVRAVVAGFAGFAVLGLFTAVSPAFLGTVLHQGDHAVTGVVVLSVFAASILGQAWSSTLGTRRALTTGCALLAVGTTLAATSLPAASLAMLVAGGVVAGTGQGLTFRAGLGSVAECTPAEQRGAVTSGYFVAFFAGISIPVIGVGIAAEAFGLVVSGTIFAAFLAVTATVALLLTARR